MLKLTKITAMPKGREGTQHGNPGHSFMCEFDDDGKLFAFTIDAGSLASSHDVFRSQMLHDTGRLYNDPEIQACGYEVAAYLWRQKVARLLEESRARGQQKTLAEPLN